MSKLCGEKEIKKSRNINIVALVLFILNFILGLYTGNKIQSAIWGLGVLVMGLQVVIQQRKLKSKVWEDSKV